MPDDGLVVHAVDFVAVNPHHEAGGFSFFVKDWVLGDCRSIDLVGVDTRVSRDLDEAASAEASIDTHLASAKTC